MSEARDKQCCETCKFWACEYECTNACCRWAPRLDATIARVRHWEVHRVHVETFWRWPLHVRVRFVLFGWLRMVRKWLFARPDDFDLRLGCWPLTEANDWCGEWAAWQSKPPPQS